MNLQFYVINSPVELNEIGYKILFDSFAKEYIDNNLSDLINKLKVYNLKTKFDVQQKSFEILFEQIEKDEFIKIKDYIYNNPIKYGTKDEELRIEDLLNLMRIYLRNEYLKLFPSLP